MYAVQKGCHEVESWNRKAKTLVQDLESTLEGFSKLLNSEKENEEPNFRKLPIKAFKIPLASPNSTKADPSTLHEIIRTGIYNLRKSSMPPTRSSSLIPMSTKSHKSPKKPSRSSKPPKPPKHKSVRSRTPLRKIHPNPKSSHS